MWVADHLQADLGHFEFHTLGCGLCLDFDPFFFFLLLFVTLLGGGGGVFFFFCIFIYLLTSAGQKILGPTLSIFELQIGLPKISPYPFF